MSRKEVLEYLEKKKVNLSANKIVLDSKTNVPFSIGCYFENGLWNLYEVGERQDFYIIESGNEEAVFKHFFLKIINRVENQM